MERAVSRGFMIYATPGDFRCLVNGYRQGRDSQALLVQLSAYGEHGDLAGTPKYLTLTGEISQAEPARVPLAPPSEDTP